MWKQVATSTNACLGVEIITEAALVTSWSLIGELVLQLHSFEIEHHHGRIGDPHEKPYGNGVLLWFEVDDFDAVVQRAADMEVQIVIPRHRNPPDGDGGRNHFENVELVWSKFRKATTGWAS